VLTRQLIRFSLVGVVNTLVHFCVFYVLYSWADFYHLLASAAGFCVAVTNSYLMNKFWTFNSLDTDIRKEFSRFFIVSLIALCINLMSMALLVERFQIAPPLAQLVTIIITLAVNFTGNKLWSFKGF
jgi:putative flippase GtrA